MATGEGPGAAGASEPRSEPVGGPGRQRGIHPVQLVARWDRLLGIRYGDPEEPLPAVVSREMLEAAEVELGDSLSIGASTFAIPIRVAAVADFFPTLDPREAPFVVTDLAGFVQYANRHNQRVVSGPTSCGSSLARKGPARAEQRHWTGTGPQPRFTSY